MCILYTHYAHRITMKPAELKNIRIKMGLTQEQFGDKLGFSREKYIQLAVLGTLANIKQPLTAHVGRHTFGGILAQLDTPIKVAQKLLGHKEMKSTEIYFHMRDKSLDKAMKGFDSL